MKLRMPLGLHININTHSIQLLESMSVKFFWSLINFIENSINMYDTKLVSYENIFYDKSNYINLVI